MQKPLEANSGGACPTFLDADLPLVGKPPVGRPPLEADPLTDAEPPVNRMTDASENITLPQTSFTGGKNPND